MSSASPRQAVSATSKPGLVCHGPTSPDVGWNPKWPIFHDWSGSYEEHEGKHEGIHEGKREETLK
jgi:hypothetical protein